MSTEKSKNYIFENNILSFESYVNEFTSVLFKEFDATAEKISLKSKIEDLMLGKVVNKTENQAAWHPKYRSNGGSSLILENDIELFDYERHPLKEKIIVKQNVKNLVTLGIGGSYEGPKLLIEAFGKPPLKRGWNSIFITGPDQDEFNFKLSGLKPDETFFVVSSKSFTTDETIESLKLAIEWSGRMENFVAITANKKEAKKYNIPKIIEFEKEIGGRYSIWSEISKPAFHWTDSEVPYDVNKLQFISGGIAADEDLLNNADYLKFLKNLVYSDIWLNNSQGKNTRAVLSYSWRLRSLADYVQQLEMESLGKQPNKNSPFKKTGQIIFGGYGPTAQHSYFQLLHQGTQNICADIVAIKDNKKSLAYAQAMTQSKLLSLGADGLLNNEEKINGNIPLNLFLLNKLDEYSLGYLIATWEHRIYITAVMLGINPFDQYGVSAGKIFTRKYLEENGG